MMTLVKLDLPTVEDVVSRLKAGDVVRIDLPADNFDRRPLENLMTRVNKVMKHHPIKAPNTHIGRTIRIVTAAGQPIKRPMPDGSEKPYEGRSAIAEKRKYPGLRLVVDIEPLP